MEDFKNIHLGKLIQKRTIECGITYSRISNFFKCNIEEIENMYSSESLDSNLLLKWSKLLEYDFFRIYTQHLILYSPPSSIGYMNTKSTLPNFRKNIYTKGIVDFVIELIESNQKTVSEVIKEYNIPKTTLHTWLIKYRNNTNDR